MAYLIDSDIMVDFTRGATEAVDYLQSIGRDCRISAITALELIAARSQQGVAISLPGGTRAACGP